MSDFQPFVYGLVDPAEVGHIRYVGMATANKYRPLGHLQEARRASSPLTYKVNWIRLLLAEGRKPAVLVLEELPTGTSTEFVGFIESCYIKVPTGNRASANEPHGWW